MARFQHEIAVIESKKNLKIGVFAYNFKHWKTQEGIRNLCEAGFKPEVILAADPVELTFYKSKIRIGTKDLFIKHPNELANYYDIDYEVTVHNSEKTAEIVNEYELDVGVILGARILKPIAFNNFKIGVINMHPGILPQNRGLDNLKWGIINDIPLGVTSHLIDKNIDRGLMIMKKTINVYEDDTLVDLHIRIQNLEQRLMVESLSYLEENGKEDLECLPKGTYYKSVPPDIEKCLMEKFKEYKDKNRCQ